MYFVLIAYAAERCLYRYEHMLPRYPKGTRKVPESFHIQTDHSVYMGWLVAESQCGVLIGEDNVGFCGEQTMRMKPERLLLLDLKEFVPLQCEIAAHILSRHPAGRLDKC